MVLNQFLKEEGLHISGTRDFVLEYKTFLVF